MGETIGIRIKASWRLMKNGKQLLMEYEAQLDLVQCEGGSSLSRTVRFAGIDDVSRCQKTLSYPLVARLRPSRRRLVSSPRA